MPYLPTPCRSAAVLCRVLGPVLALAACSGPAHDAGTAQAAVAPQPVVHQAPVPDPGPYADLGIRIESLRLTGADYLLDFRYRVLDPAKAARLLNSRKRPYLLDEATGEKVFVPESSKLGPIRSSGRNLKKNRIYFALFVNPGRLIKPGAKVTVVLGGHRFEHLRVAGARGE